ncbi:MAG TPA: hypothetical protein VHC20_01475 [Candidatus Paceibacterota bacterium]|nr:hypothetical protein [Candidatus Paceibacterota bacterium]
MHEAIELEALGELRADARLERKAIIVAGAVDLSARVGHAADEVDVGCDGPVAA